jgi:RNase_H superfamily
MRLLTKRKGNREAVEIQEKRFGYFPKAFRWHGKRYDVQAIERCWTAARRSPHLCFRVRCNEGIFDLYQNIRDNTWHLVALRAA